MILELSDYEDRWYNFDFVIIVLLSFVLFFDVEMVFLYAWAMSFNVLGVSALIEAFLFLLILIVVSVYAWQKRALE